MNEATQYNWKAKYGGMAISEARRLNALEDENLHLKKLVVDQVLDMQMLKEINKKGRLGFLPPRQPSLFGLLTISFCR